MRESSARYQERTWKGCCSRERGAGEDLEGVLHDVGRPPGPGLARPQRVVPAGPAKVFTCRRRAAAGGARGAGGAGAGGTGNGEGPAEGDLTDKGPKLLAAAAAVASDAADVDAAAAVVRSACVVLGGRVGAFGGPPLKVYLWERARVHYWQRGCFRADAARRTAPLARRAVWGCIPLSLSDRDRKRSRGICHPERSRACVRACVRACWLLACSCISV